MRNYKTYCIITIMILAMTGCFKHTYHVGTGAPDGELVYKHWHHHWVFGLIGGESLDQAIDLKKICPSGNATIHEEISFVNGLVDVLIGIVYSPTTVTIRCAESSEPIEVNLSAEEVTQIVTDPYFILAVERMVPHRLEAVFLALENNQKTTPSDPITLIASMK